MTLSIGDKGPQVMHLQSALKALGIGLPKYGVDGIFGPETQAAVKQAQQQFGLPTNGIAGQGLLQKLGINPKIITQRPPQASVNHKVLLFGSLTIIAIGIAIKTIRRQ
ncbi:peptidoglycan-binding domain-containing protein [Fodinibius sediminis]|uniref:Peptidoglycan binding domain-containing protein n=1 Tax=Fodinibius sediminis TaxID=1214077 RepID=A0A521F9W0_9BACT|nr:peptidoglycan-binding protein [Fodinibius sediminis]SMO92943.1 Putative peptidoglycan binding domain-containing protein [Fodinibius sediminis]